MKLFGKEISRQKLLYGGLITTFAILYGATAFVSWYHAITFFNIANAVWLSVILSFVAEIGQASALFSLLLTDNTKRFLTWFVMIVLTALQVIGNVVSSYDWIIKHDSAGVDAFQKSILFWMQTADPEIFKVVIAWISGALLPIIALSMTALVAQNMDLSVHKAKTKLDDESNVEPKPEPVPSKEQTEPIDASILMSEMSKVRVDDETINNLEIAINQHRPKTREEVIADIQEEELRASEEKVNEPIQGALTDEESEAFKKEIDERIQKKVDEEIERIKRLMTVKSEQTEAIPETVKKIVAPGVNDYDNEIVNDDTLEKQIKEVTETYNKSNIPQSILPEIDLVAESPYKEEPQVDEEIPPIDQLTNEEVENELYQRQLDEEVARLIPEPEPQTETPEPEVEITSTNGLVGIDGAFEPMEKPTEPSGGTISADEAKQKEEFERLERLRAIARENLKKK